MQFEPILALFKIFSIYLEASIWIRIRIKVEARNPDLHQSYKQDPNPDPHKSDADPQHC
jgi:hypothetical protein